MKSLSELYMQEIRELHDAQSRLAAGLVKIAQCAGPVLQRSLQAQAAEAEQRRARIAHLCQALGVNPRGEVCDVIHGLLATAQEQGEAIRAPLAREAALLAGALRMKAVEAATFSTLQAHARLLGYEVHARWFERTTDELDRTVQSLRQMADDLKLCARAA